MRKTLKWITGIVLLTVLLPLVLALSLYIPPIQRWAVQTAAKYAGEATGLDITLKSLRITFPLDIELEALRIRQEETEMVSVGHATIGTDLRNIFKGELGVKGIELSEGRLDLTIPESTEDTTESKPLPLSFRIRSVELNDVHLMLHLPDSVGIEAQIRHARAKGGNVLLENGLYNADSFMLQADSLRYGQFVFRNIDTDIRNIHFAESNTYVVADIIGCSFNEGHGINLEQLSCKLATDTTSLNISGLEIRTAHSTATGEAHLDWSSTRPEGGGRMTANLQSSIGHQDVLAALAVFMPGGKPLPYPERPIVINADAGGNIDSLDIHTLRISMPDVAEISATGSLTSIADTLRMGANIDWDITTKDLSCIRRYLGLDNIALPPMRLTADTRVRDCNKVEADMLLQEGRGRARLLCKADIKRMAYDANMHIHNLQLQHFFPHDSLRGITASITASGQGTDMLAQSTRLMARAKVHHLGYAQWDLDSIDVQARLRKGEGSLELYSNNELLKMQACADATLKGRCMTASSFTLDMSHIDLYALNLSKDTLSASMIMHMEGNSDFRQTHRLEVEAKAMELITKDTVYHPVELKLSADMTTEYINASANAGDMKMTFKSAHGIDSLLARSNNFMKELKTQADSLYIRQDTLKTLLPDVGIHIDCGGRNPVSNIMRYAMGYTYAEFNIDLHSNTTDGITGGAHAYSLNTGAILIDTIEWNILQKKEGIFMDARVKNGKKNKAGAFESRLYGHITPTGASLNTTFTDAKGKTGVDFGLTADILSEGTRIRFTPLAPIIAYRNFALNEDNYIELTKDGRVDANVDLLADDGTGLKLYSTPNEEAKQDVSLSINHLNLGELSLVLPYMPEIQGFLHGDFHYMQADSTLTVSAAMDVNGMKYEGTPMGDIGMDAIYFPNTDGSHYVDGIVTHNGNEILTLSGRYMKQNENGTIEAMASLNHAPFSLANAFIPDGLIRFEGYADGDIQMEGNSSNPILSGNISTDSLHIMADDYNVKFNIPEGNIAIDESRIILDKLKAYAAGKTPLTIDGGIDLSDISRIGLDIKLEADNYQLINAPKTKEALTYGKVYVDLRTRLWGTSDNLKMMGRLNVLGNTDVSYVLKDSPITVQDRLSEIVTFCDFSDTIKVEAVETTAQSIDMQMNITIEQAAMAHCILSDDGSDYIDLRGGGDLNFTYDLLRGMQLFGRYTIQEGTMHYSMMAIPLNDFKIAEGSYAEFHGNVTNPTLNIKASERIKANVAEDGASRKVAFDVGLAVTQNLEDMGLEFTLEAPEDMSVQNQLAAMSAEDRGKTAVTMLVTGMYLLSDSGFKNGFSYSNTLNSYLQTAINGLAGKALNTVDVNVGIENKTTTEGTTTTDYSFSFAKRFWGNRFSVIVGGKVSTGKDAVNNGQTIIDNISIEYRLDKNSTRYVRVYYDRNYESILEGELTEMGAGLVLRKKTERMGELFLFRDRKKKKQQEKEAQL